MIPKALSETARCSGNRGDVISDGDGAGGHTWLVRPDVSDLNRGIHDAFAVDFRRNRPIDPAARFPFGAGLLARQADRDLDEGLCADGMPSRRQRSNSRTALSRVANDVDMRRRSIAGDDVERSHGAFGDIAVQVIAGGEKQSGPSVARIAV